MPLERAREARCACGPQGAVGRNSLTAGISHLDLNPSPITYLLSVISDKLHNPS